MDPVHRFQEWGCRIQAREPLSAHTTFRIGGEAEWFVTADTAEQVRLVRQYCHETHTPLLIIGNGSNLLVGDNGVDGVVLHITAASPDCVIDGTTVTASAGLSLTKLCSIVAEAGLSGLEFAYGIPGSVGGGVYMNAGAYGGELADVIRRVTVITPTGDVCELSAEDMAFGYRHSVCMQRDLTVWSVTMELCAASTVDIRERMADYLRRRREKQPLEYPSAGSFFKRPEGHFAGALIEQCGLKGKTVGGAQVSEKHAGFFINRGGATCQDVMALCREVQESVRQRFGVELEREVQLVGR